MELEAINERDKPFSFRLRDGDQVSPWANYRQICYLNGKVGCTDYYTGEGEKILTPEEFVQLIAVRE